VSKRGHRCIAALLAIVAWLAWTTPAVAAPANDLFANATVIPSLPYSTSQNTTTATKTASDPFCYFDKKTVWYKFTPAQNMQIRTDAAGSNYDVSLSVYTGSEGSLSQVGCKLNAHTVSPDNPPFEFAAQGATTYYFMLSSANGDGGTLRFHVSLVPPPANDDFDQATVISALPYTDILDPAGATPASDDPTCDGANAHTIWYAFTPAQNARVSADTYQSAVFTTLSLYTGARGSLTQIACDNHHLNAYGARVEFDAVVGTTYYLMATKIDVRWVDERSLRLHVQALPPPPANDDIDAATVIPTTPLPFTDAVDARGATVASDDPSIFGCDGRRRTVWYSFTPSENTRIHVNTRGSDYQAMVYAFTGSRGALTLVGCDDPLYSDLPSRLNFDAVADTTYYLMIGLGPRGGGLGGQLSLTVRAVPPAPNDDFDDAVPIASLPLTDAIDSRAATIGADDPRPSCLTYQPEKTVWYSFQTDLKRRVVIDTIDSSGYVNVAVFTGSRGALTEVACSGEQTCCSRGKVGLDALGGTTYYVMLGTIPAWPGGDWIIAAEPGLLDSKPTLQASATKVKYGRSVRLTAHLPAFDDASNTELTIYQTPSGGTKTALVSGPVDENGDLTIVVRPERTTTYVAEWEGDDRYAPGASLIRKVRVQVVVTTTLAGYYGRSGAYKLYRPGADPRVTGKVAPNHAGMKLTFWLQVRFGGRWEFIGTPRFRLGPRSSVTVILQNPPSGYAFRIKGVFPADSDHLGGASSWKYFRVG
jgi:hypothetical protein